MSQVVVAQSSTEVPLKRRQVMSAAEQLFLQHGYGAVSMDQVARTAGVSKATLYAYFPSKDALFATIVSDKGVDNPLSPEMFPADVTDLRAALEELGQRTLRFMLRERTLAIYRIALAESARFPEMGLAFYANGPSCMIERFSGWLEILRRRGMIECADTTMATHQFMALMRSGVFLRRSLSVPPEASEAEINATVKAAADTWLKAFSAEVLL